MPKNMPHATALSQYQTGDIIASHTGSLIDFNTLIDEISQVDVVYVGERHSEMEHHQIQLRILTALVNRHGSATVGMEMFAHTYQKVLNRWSAQQMDQSTFLKQTHWYANWRFDYSLYAPILTYVRDHQLPLIGLNIPFHIPPKIAIGGLDSLNTEEKQHLPEKIDTTNAAHRQYVQRVFAHHQVKGREDFSTFYQAQCTWEDAMADTLSKHLGNNKMVVLAGNGHIIKKFGIPQRAHQRNRAPYRTIYLSPADSRIDLSYGDYIWVTEKTTLTGQTKPMSKH